MISQIDHKCFSKAVSKYEDNDKKRKKHKPFLIGVSGGTASGKSSVCKKIVEQLNRREDGKQNQSVYVVSLDSFYKELDDGDMALASKNLYNFDHPKAFDYDMLKETMLKMIEGISVDVYDYDHVNFKKMCTNPVKISNPDVVFIEGILVFYQEDIKSLFDIKLFVEADADTRLARRVIRDIDSLGRPLESILDGYVNYVKPSFEEFCLPTKKYADVIIPRGADNNVAVEVIVQHIKDLLKKRLSSAEQLCNNGNAGIQQQQQQQLQQQLLSRPNCTNNASPPGATLLNLRPH